MSIRMNHLFYVGKSLPTRKEDSKLQIGLLILCTTHGLEVGKAISAGWDSLYSFVWYKVGMVLA